MARKFFTGEVVYRVVSGTHYDRMMFIERGNLIKGFRRDTWLRNPNGKYLKLVECPSKHNCPTCNGKGEVEQEVYEFVTDIMPTTKVAACSTCQGQGLYLSLYRMPTYVLDRTSLVFTREQYDQAVGARLQREAERVMGEVRRQARINSAIYKLVEAIEAGDDYADKVQRAATFINAMYETNELAMSARRFTNEVARQSREGSAA